MLAVVPMYTNRYHRFNTALHDALEGVVDTTHPGLRKRLLPTVLMEVRNTGCSSGGPGGARSADVGVVLVALVLVVHEAMVALEGGWRDKR